MECEGEWATQKLTSTEELTTAEIVLQSMILKLMVRIMMMMMMQISNAEEVSVDASEVADYMFVVEGDDKEAEEDQDEGEENDDL